MSYIIGSSIQWGSDPRIKSAELTKTTYLFFRIACHSLWPISHLHTIPLKRCVFLYAFVSSASISFPHLFLRSLNEVHRSSAIAHALIHPIFIYRILLFLGLADFPADEPVHVIASIGDTFLRQRAAHLRVGLTHPRAASSGVVPPPPSSTGVDTAEALDHVLTVQAAHGQILVDVLDEICALHAELAQFRQFSPPPPFDDGF